MAEEGVRRLPREQKATLYRRAGFEPAPALKFRVILGTFRKPVNSRPNHGIGRWAMMEE